MWNGVRTTQKEIAVDERTSVSGSRRRLPLVLAVILTLLLAACANGDGTGESPGETGGAATDSPGMDSPTDGATASPDEGGEPTAVTGGFVGAIDQIGLPAALDQGFFEEHNIDVTINDPYATGVDMLNALQAGEIQFAQVGVPAIGAILSGMDLVLLGNYTGSASQLGIDETMAMVARADSGIEGEDLSTLEGKKIGVSIGSINHLYVLGLLEEAGLEPDQVELVNTPPPEMAVALQTSGLDAVVVWDPWPIIALRDVEGTYEVTRGGGRIAFLGYIVAERSWAEANPDAVNAFLAARAQADHWIRENPDAAAETATRWLPGTDLDVATAAMEYNIRQLDPRLSACNYAALHRAQQTLNELDAIDGTFDVNDHFAPDQILAVMEEHPEYFEDLPEIPEAAQIGEDFTFEPDSGMCDD